VVLPPQAGWRCLIPDRRLDGVSGVVADPLLDQHAAGEKLPEDLWSIRRMSITDPVSIPINEINNNDPKYGKRLIRLFEHLRDSAYDREDIWQFIAFAMGHVSHSKAGLFQDLWAFWMAGQKRGGFFVEFGAADGVFLSNSHFLEKEMGWKGLLAEPNPAFARSLRKHRGCVISSKCVYSRSGEEIGFLAAVEGEFSRIADLDPGDGHEARRLEAGQLIKVQTISLNDLLIEHAAPSCIDFLSVDTEGSEFEILNAFDFDRWDVRAIAVEHNFTPVRERLYDLLTANGYSRKWPELSRFDDWYAKA
jgi:FkbM family methyltransferase